MSISRPLVFVGPGRAVVASSRRTGRANMSAFEISRGLAGRPQGIPLEGGCSALWHELVDEGEHTNLWAVLSSLGLSPW
ncbi:hypothetical protein GGTG_03683 [Gaeumannomyces tritici R3-111a-1]|uniref:Uncharacterized protein n=1 Tax=Gaeumannomyces tritici (strain R3-111a-1) TaxID=644352 RepID=J3NQX8_GAET3|nr:hypothetical protein GGTG_03683 [Gaeumannomyces tritici R3-111a-1]EJT78584.1 hypothetical protein GGTG_03683 [Gaeumannomyces tritici R3-111a-1]